MGNTKYALPILCDLYNQRQAKSIIPAPTKKTGRKSSVISLIGASNMDQITEKRSGANTSGHVNLRMKSRETTNPITPMPIVTSAATKPVLQSLRIQPTENEMQDTTIERQPIISDRIIAGSFNVLMNSLTSKLTCRRGISELQPRESRHAPPGRCSAWLGVLLLVRHCLV